MLSASITNLETLFNAPVSYRIPQFQRPYAWRRDSQWLPLWLDISQRAERYRLTGGGEVPPHFLGAIVLFPQTSLTGEVQKRIVVDGQQRLTSLQLLIKAAEEAFLTRNDTARAARLRKLTKNDESNLGSDPSNDTKIRQSNINDQNAFQLVMRNLLGAGPRPPSMIIEAFDFFKGQVIEWLNDAAVPWSEQADTLEHVLTERVQIAAIDLDEGEQPHIIFETLNERGEPLTQSDRIKNTVMYKANVVDDADKARDLWGMFEDEWWRQMTREGRLNRTQNDRFLNYWMVMKKRGEVISERVASDFRTLLESESYKNTFIKEVAEEIKHSGVFYRDIEEDSLPEMSRFLKRVKAIEIGSVTPVLLWLHTSNVPAMKKARVHAALESFLVRRMLCGLGSMGLNRYFQELLSILDEASEADSILIDHLKKGDTDTRIWPNDRTIREKLIGNPLGGNAIRQRMVMEAIEISLRGDLAEDLGSTENLTLEHIMPQRWELHWPLADDEKSDQDRKWERGQAVKEIGNLTLVTQKLNSSISNGPWVEKRVHLSAHSSLFLNKRLLEDVPEIWDEDAIRARSTKLVEQILKIWPHAVGI